MLEKIKKALKRKLRPFKNILTGKPAVNSEFGRRIKHRHSVFWDSAEGKELRRTPMNPNIPLAEWQQVAHWQRRLSNKYNSREFAKKHGCRVPELYWYGTDTSQINFGALPAQYVIRPTIGHSCQSVFLMDGTKNLLDAKDYSPQDITSVMDKVTADNPGLEFLIEEFVRTETGEYSVPDDYKFYMFNGQLAFVQVINRFSYHDGSTSFYDGEWKRIENVNSIYAQAPPQPKPQSFDEMLAGATKLSKAYGIFVRIDFYATDKGAVFGEFTPTPGLGAAFTPFGDKLLTGYWDKHCTGMI